MSVQIKVYKQMLLVDATFDQILYCNSTGFMTLIMLVVDDG